MLDDELHSIQESPRESNNPSPKGEVIMTVIPVRKTKAISRD